MIKSKFAIGRVYLTVLFLIGFLALGVFFLAHPDMPMHNKFGTTTGAWLPGLVIMGGGGLLFYILLKKMVLVHIYMDRLELRSLFFRQTIYKRDIDTIDLTARADMGVLGGNRVGNATVIKYGETEKYILLDFLYRNVPELKQALQENFLSSPGTAPLFPEYAGGRAPLPSGEEDVAERFVGNALLSVNGVLTLICFFIPFLFYRPHAGNRYAVLIAEMIVPVSLYFVFGTQMFYFKLSNEFLIIKNHFFPWYARGYKLDTIKDIVFESPYKRSNALRVTTKDFASKAFSAGSLRKDTWKDLEKRLEENGIPVKNEL